MKKLIAKNNLFDHLIERLYVEVALSVINFPCIHLVSNQSELSTNIQYPDNNFCVWKRLRCD